jgi:hypothetical protein
LTPQTKTVIVTEALRRVPDAEITVTVTPVRPGPDGPEVPDALHFERFRLVLFG